MLLASALHEILIRSHSQMLQHNQHALLPIHRYEIYKMLNNDAILKGQKNYENLAIVTAEYVLPIWYSTWPTDSLPQHVLDTAKEVLKGTSDLILATQIVGAAWEKLEQYGNIPNNPATSHAFHAGQAAVEALFAVLGRPPFNDAVVGEHYTDADLDPWSSDPVLWAVTAYAGGVWEQKSDPNKRREFWEWWLTEAIPTVLHSKDQA